jgi:hypothetical protein
MWEWLRPYIPKGHIVLLDLKSNAIYARTEMATQIVWQVVLYGKRNVYDGTLCIVTNKDDLRYQSYVLVEEDL